MGAGRREAREAPEAQGGASEPSRLGALLTPSPTALHRLTVLSHPQLGRDIMSGNG